MAAIPYKQKFIIFAPAYNEQQGGALVLHYLCHYLNEIGYDAVIWHKNRPVTSNLFEFRQYAHYLKKEAKWAVNRVKRKSNSLNTPLARRKDLIGAIVIYGEKIKGNPLESTKVVRWFLHKPGYHTGELDYGDEELYFYYQPVFDDVSLTGRSNFPLFISVWLKDTFKQSRYAKREGTCYILRKGRDRKILHDLDSGIVIDNLTNSEIANVFNRCEYCISYDLYTFYSQYAAICGCKSIVVPEIGVGKLEWQPKMVLRYGIAYGEEDLMWAIETKEKLLDYLEQEEQRNISATRDFAEQSLQFFSQ